MKKVLLISGLMLLFLAGTANKTNQKKVIIPSGVHDADYWKAQAYVNLEWMKYKIEKIISNDSLNQTKWKK